MGKGLNFEVHKNVFDRHEKGETFSSIGKDYGIKYQTVRQKYVRYKMYLKYRERIKKLLKNKIIVSNSIELEITNQILLHTDVVRDDGSEAPWAGYAIIGFEEIPALISELKIVYKLLKLSGLLQSAQQGAAPDAESGELSNLELHSN
jgi:hypothetical protein